jgi:saccharopine dehydrogenase (NADP+, L-glutamate forming)
MNASELDAMVAKHDLVVSLIPYTFHVAVIESAIRNKKNVVTTSYVSPAIKELDAKCKEAGITVMNEIGLDPGIGEQSPIDLIVEWLRPLLIYRFFFFAALVDHLWAVKTISEVHAAGGKVR